MRPVRFAILAGVTVLAVAGAVAAVMQNQSASSLAKGQPLFPGLAGRLASAQTIEIQRETGKVVLARSGDAWTLADRAGYPARADQVRKLLVSLTELETIEAKTRNPELYDRLSLQDEKAKDAKSTLITVKDDKGAALASLYVGKRRLPKASAPGGATGDMLYIRKAGDPQTWLVAGAVEVKDGAVDWANRDVLEIPPTRVKSVEVAVTGQPALAVEKAKPEDKDFVVRDMPADQTVKSQFDVNGIAGVLEGLTFDDVAPVTTVDGLTARSTDHFALDGGLAVTVSLLAKDDQVWARIAASGEGHAAAEAKTINDRVGAWVYKLPTYKVERLEAKRETLLQPKPQS